MSRHPELYQWIDTVVTRFPTLSKPQACGLALWSFGMILVRSCSLSAVAHLLAPLLNQSFNTVRERLRDTYREASAKAGNQRAELDLSVCWGPWLACGFWMAGKVSNGRLRWTRRVWAIVLSCWPSAFSIAAVPCRWRGKC